MRHPQDTNFGQSLVWEVPDAATMEEIGMRLGRVCPEGMLIFLQGDLGAGKTTVVRGFLHGRGYTGRVKSPTYTLLEPYRTGRSSVYHLDLYRIHDPEELEAIGIRDYFDGEGICLIEWPEKGATLLPVPDLHIRITFGNCGRVLSMQPRTPRGRELLKTAAAPV